MFRQVLILSLLFSWKILSLCSSEEDPAPNGNSNRVLSMVVAYTLSRMDPILHTIRGHQNMCEGGWDVTFTIFTTQRITRRMRHFLESKLYCHRLEAHIPLVIHKHDPSVKINLVEEMKDHMRKVWNDYNVYIYMEEDCIVDHTHLVGYLAETKKLQGVLGKDNVLNNYYVGFQRYRRHLMPMEKMRNHMTEDEVISQEYLEEIPFFKPVCFNDKPYMEVSGNKIEPAANVYQAMWILTKEQVRVLQTKCKFLDQTFRDTPMQKSGYVREYLGSLSLLENDIIGPSCGLKKIIPAGRLLDFSVWHYYYSTNPLLLTDSHPLFGVHEHIQAGLLQMNTPLAYAGYYDNLACWAPIVAKQRSAMHLNLNAENVTALQMGRQIQILKNGKKHYVVSMDALAKHGYDQLPRHDVRHPLFDALPQGEDLK